MNIVSKVKDLITEEQPEPEAEVKDFIIKQDGRLGVTYQLSNDTTTIEKTYLLTSDNTVLKPTKEVITHTSTPFNSGKRPDEEDFKEHFPENPSPEKLASEVLPFKVEQHEELGFYISDTYGEDLQLFQCQNCYKTLKPGENTPFIEIEIEQGREVNHSSYCKECKRARMAAEEL